MFKWRKIRKYIQYNTYKNKYMLVTCIASLDIYFVACTASFCSYICLGT